MKKIAVIMAALAGAALVVSFGACSKAKKEGGGTADKLRVRMVTDPNGIDDKSFNAAGWRGLLSYYGDTWDNPTGRGVYYDYIACPTDDAFVPTLKQAADMGYDLVLTFGISVADALAEVADQYPDQYFSSVDIDWYTRPNIMQFMFKEEEGSYLAGMAAGLKAKEDGIENPKFGFIGGVSNPTLTKFEMGYIQGIRAVIPGAALLDYYTNDWTKTELAKTQAKSWFDNGAYIIFSAAGNAGNGAIAQAKEYRLQGKNVWAIGVDSDQYEDGIYSGTESAVYTSMIKKVEIATIDALKAVASKSFKGGVITLGMKENGVDYAKTNPAMSDEIKEKLDAAKKAITDGSVKVHATYKETLAAGLAPAGLSLKE
jgi:basic membrane protein A